MPPRCVLTQMIPGPSLRVIVATATVVELYCSSVMPSSQTPSPANSRQDMLANLPVKKLLWTLTLPAMGGMFTMSLYNVVDTIFIGRGVGSTALAGVTIAFPVMMLMMALGFMVGIGAAAVASISLGAGNIARAERTLGNAVTLSLLFGLLIMAVGIPNSAQLVRIFGASPEATQPAMDYLDIILLGSAFSLFPMAINHMARAEGAARVAMVNMIIGAVLNIVLDPLFIFVFDMGVRGAAVATVISQAVTCVYVTRYFLSGRSTLRLLPANLLLDGAVSRQILSVGFPSLLRMSAASVITLLINRTLAAYGGDLSIAAFGIVNRSMMFLSMPLIAISQGLQPVLGFSYGAQRYDRALDVTHYALRLSTAFSVAASLVLLLVPRLVVQAFTTDPALVAEGVHASRMMFLAFSLVGYQIVGSTVFQSLGMVSQTLITQTSRQIVLLIPLLLILPRFLGTDGVWLAHPVSDVLSFFLVLFFLVPHLREMKRRQMGRETEVLHATDVP